MRGGIAKKGFGKIRFLLGHVWLMIEVLTVQRAK